MSIEPGAVELGFKLLTKFVNDYAKDTLGNTIFWIKALTEERESKSKTCIKRITNGHFRLIFKFPKDQKYNYEVQKILIEQLQDDNTELLDKEEIGLLRGNFFVRTFKDSILFKTYTHEEYTLEFWDYHDLSHKSVSYFSSIF